MGLDTRYIPIFNLQEYFVDNVTGDALSGGFVSFYSDNNQSVPKQVYELVATGQPPAYTYNPIGTQLQLSDVGTFVDGNGADIAPYLFPYDSNGNLDLYYITVDSSTLSRQFTRNGVPNLESAEDAGDDPNLINHVPNGQFQLHNDYAPVPGTVPVQLNFGGTRGNVDVVSLAPGGLFFERTHGSTAVDTVSFIRSTQYTGGTATASPRYTLQIQRGTGANDAVCGFTVRFMDVFKFSNPETNPAEQPQLTLLFNGNVTTGSLSGITVNQIQYFGTSLSTGGSPGSTTIINPLATGIAFTTSFRQFAVTFPYLPSSSNLIGTDDNDFMEFEIAFPPNQTWTVQLSDIMLLNGSYSGGLTVADETLFPQLTNGQFLLEALSNIAPTTQPTATSPYYAQDGSDLYLPMVKTKDGWTYDYAQIGKVEGSFNDTAIGNQLLCDGSQLQTSGYSTLGIPYSRLQTVLYNTTLKLPIFGTGVNFVNTYITSADTSKIIMITNKPGLQALATNANIASFTFATVCLGQVSIGYKAYSNSTGIVSAISTFTNGCFGNAKLNAGTSGMTMSATHNEQTVSPFGTYYEFYVTSLGAAALANTGAAGLYFTFSSHTVNYYVWFKITNETDPAPGGTGIKVDLTSIPTASAADVGKCIAAAISGFQCTTIAVAAAASITTGDYFTITANAVAYNVWYNKNSGGGAPAGTLIEVDITTETAPNVAIATVSAINSEFFALPDLRGMFLRGADPTGIWDIDVGFRFGYAASLAGTSVGSFELDQIYNHYHQLTNHNSGNTTTDSGQGNGANAGLVTTAGNGGSESRPVNAFVNWYIRY